MDYRSNLFYPPVEQNCFGEPNNANYSTFSSQMAPKNYNTSVNPFSHSTSIRNDNFDGSPIPHNYETFLSRREIIITSQCQDSEGSSKSKPYRSKSRSPHKCFHDKRKRNKRSRSHERRSRNVEIKSKDLNYNGDHYSFSNQHQSDSARTYNSNTVHKQDGISYDSGSKLLIQINTNQGLDNSSSKNRYLPQSNMSISQTLGQSQDSNSSLESSPLDNEPGYYLNYPSTKKNLVIENPFSGALYLQNIQSRDDTNKTSTTTQFHSDTFTSAKGIRTSYEKQDKPMQRSDRNQEEFSQNIHSMSYNMQASPSVVLVSSGSEDNLDSDCNFGNKKVFPNYNDKGFSFSGSLLLSGQDIVKPEQQSIFGGGKTLIEGGQMKVNYLNNNSHGSREKLQNISDDNNDSVIPDFNSDTSKLTPEQWITVIEEVSRKRGWNDEDRRYMMTSRLRGLASKWYLSKGINYNKWDSLKNMFIRAFPTQIEYYTLLKRMMTRKKEEDESISNYFQHKVALLNACEIYGRRAVSCIIYGITNDKILREAQRQHFDNIDSLYSFLCTCNFTSEPKYDKEDKYTLSKVQKHVTMEVSQSKAIKTGSSKTKAVKTEFIKTTGVQIKTVKVSKSVHGNRCFRCGSPNHWKSSCKNLPKLCCSKCGRSNVMTNHCDC